MRDKDHGAGATASQAPTTFSFAAIVPTCDRPALLHRALASIRTQEAPPAEVIVVDDSRQGEADAVDDIVRASGIAGIRLIVTAGATGPSAARNSGAKQATASRLAFLDDDDEWLPPYLRAAGERCARDHLDVLCTDLVYRYDDGSERPGKTAPDVLDSGTFLFRNPGIIGSNLIIARRLYDALGGFNELLPTLEDMDFGYRLSRHPGVTYGRMAHTWVRHYQHTAPRLCTRSGDAMRAGVRRFYALHSAHMTAAQHDEYCRKVRELWSVDQYGIDVPAAGAGAPA